MTITRQPNEHNYLNYFQKQPSILNRLIMPLLHVPLQVILPREELSDS